MDYQGEDKKKYRLLIWIVISGFLALGVLGLVIYYTIIQKPLAPFIGEEKKRVDRVDYVVSEEERVNYLIPGVPYFGVYNHISDVRSKFAAAAASVLGYWGDRRYVLYDLRKSVPDLDFYFSPLSFSVVLGLPDVQDFFRENGYETAFTLLGENERENLRLIKQFVNPQQKIPVVVFQNLSTDKKRPAVTVRVVVGVFDDKQEIVVHDFYWGSNFVLSYDEFFKLFAPGSNSFLAAWPSDILAQSLPPSGSGLSPQRTKAMDAFRSLFTNFADRAEIKNIGQELRAVVSSREIINDPLFKFLPRIYRIIFYRQLAIDLMRAGKTDEAIQIVKEKALPLNHDLDVDEGGGDFVGQFQTFPLCMHGVCRAEKAWEGPFVTLAQAYVKKGDFEKARQNLTEVMRILPMCDIGHVMIDTIPELNDVPHDHPIPHSNLDSADERYMKLKFGEGE